MADDTSRAIIKLLKYWDPVETDLVPDNIYPVTIDRAVYENSTGKTLDVVLSEKTSINDSAISSTETWSSSKINSQAPNDGVLSLVVDGVTKTFSANSDENVTVTITHKNQELADWDQADTTHPSYINNKPTDLGDFTNNAGYLILESDPIFSQSPAGSITSNDVSNWNNKADRGTTLSDYGILDASIQGLNITLGQDTISVVSVETDPIFNASAAKNITSNDIASWNDKADAASVYTKSEMDIKLALKANATRVTALEGVVEGKVNIALGVAHEGEMLVVNDQGDLELTAFSEIDDTTTAVSTTWSSDKINTLLGTKADSSSLATVATSGDYTDLSNTPTIGNATITINKDNVKVDDFNLNDTSNKTINITVAGDISAHNSSALAHSDIRTAITNINKLIPSEATENNKLADKDYVIDLIRLNSTDYICANDRMTVGYDHLSVEAALMDQLTSLEGGPWYKMTDSGIVSCGSTSGVYVTKDDYSIVSKDETRTYFYAHGFRYQRQKDGVFGSVILPDGLTTAQITLDLSLMAYKFTDTTHVFDNQDIEFIIRGVNVPCEEYIGGYVSGATPDNTYPTYTQTSRYVCIGDLTANSAPVWSFQYIVSDISLTDVLLSAINSGITSAKVTNYDSHLADTTIHVTSADKTSWNGKAEVSDIPTVVSDLTNDAGYITSADLSGLATETYVNNHHDSTKLDVIDSNNKLDYSLLDNTPTIPTVPTNVSAFTNDAGYLTQHQDISGKADKANTIAGYGINDAYISGNTITLGNKSVTPLTTFIETDPVFSASAAATITTARMDTWDAKLNHATTLSGYGITDAKIENGTITLGSNTITPLTSFVETDPLFSASAASGITALDITSWNNKAESSTTLAGYGITNAYTKIEVDNALLDKANVATTLAGYGIDDAKIVNGVITLGNETITPVTAETDPIFSASAASTIVSSDIDAWNAKIDEAPNDGTSYVRNSEAWQLLQTLIPVGTYKGTVPTLGDLPTMPFVALGDEGSNSTVLFKYYFNFTDPTHISGMSITVEPTGTTKDAWFRNSETWTRGGSTNIAIDGITLADIGYTCDLTLFGKGKTRANITFTNIVAVSNTSTATIICRTWGATDENDLDRGNEYTLTNITLDFSTLNPITPGSTYKAIDTGLFYVYNNGTWTSSEMLAEHNSLDPALLLVGGSGVYSLNSIREAFEDLSYLKAVKVISTATTLNSNCRKYINVEPAVAGNPQPITVTIPTSLQIGHYELNGIISYYQTSASYFQNMTIVTEDNVALPLTRFGTYGNPDGAANFTTFRHDLYIVEDLTTTSGKAAFLYSYYS